MIIIITETGKREELTLIDRKTGQDMSADIIGNSGTELDFVDNAYRMSQDDYLWWSDYLDMTARYNDQLDALREQYGTAVDDIITRPELSLSDDYTAHEQELQALVDAIRDELGEQQHNQNTNGRNKEMKERLERMTIDQLDAIREVLCYLYPPMESTENDTASALWDALEDVRLRKMSEYRQSEEYKAKVAEVNDIYSTLFHPQEVQQ